MKAVLTVIGKLSDRTINGDLLKFLARTANDEQPGIRTNTTICLGKIAKHLGQSVCHKVPWMLIWNDADNGHSQDQRFSLLPFQGRLEIPSSTPEMPVLWPSRRQWNTSAKRIAQPKSYRLFARLCLTRRSKDTSLGYILPLTDNKLDLSEIRRTKQWTCTCSAYGSTAAQCLKRRSHRRMPKGLTIIMQPA